jgi:NADH-quinone oxidoreductase subunit J
MVGIILFAILALIAVVAAIGLLTSTNAVHAALFLVINFLCVALFYLGLNAPFLAMVQVTIYAGAIMVLFLFVIMLLGAERLPLSSRLPWQAPLAVVLVVLLVAVTAFILFSPAVGVSLGAPQLLGDADLARTYGSPASVGERLFTEYMLPFQIVGLLLLVAMIGAVVLTKNDTGAHPRRQGSQDAPPPADSTAAD